MELEEGSLVLGIVEKVEQTSVFVKLDTGKVGTIVSSEIAPGRIKNLREYVAPNKIIVCKVLRISGDRLELSLRRVSVKEKKEIMNRHRREKDLDMGLKSILKESYLNTIEKIKKDFETVSTFFEQAQTNDQILEKYIPKNLLEQIRRLTEKEKREVEVKKIIKLRCIESDGIKRIREIFNLGDKNTRISYLSAGNYLLTVKGEDYKKANQIMQESLAKIETKSKKSSCELSIEDKK